MTTITQYRNRLIQMPDAEVRALYETFNSCTTRSVSEEIILSLIEQELQSRWLLCTV